MSNLIEKGKVFAAADSIAYAAGSVVSKTILKKPSGNVTLFSFDAGEGLSEHSSPHEALVHILDGSAAISIAGEMQEVHTGQCLILPANIPHALKAVERFKMMLVMIKSWSAFAFLNHQDRKEQSGTKEVSVVQSLLMVESDSLAVIARRSRVILDYRNDGAEAISLIMKTSKATMFKYV